MASSSDFTFVHAADLHLDTPFKGLSETAPHVGEALREASLEAFDDLVELCIEREAAFLVVAGDVYDGSERGLRAQLRFRNGLQRLAEAGISCFVAHGNHDPIEEGWSAVTSWPERVHVFGHGSVESFTVKRDGAVIATVHGTSYARRDTSENLSERFKGVRGAGLNVAVLHCAVTGASEGHASYSPCSLEDLRSHAFDYWALGHVHAHSVLSKGPSDAGGYVVYSGDLQARSPKQSELGAKGAVVVDVREGKVHSLEHIACDRVRFAVLEVDIGSCEGAGDVVEELIGAAAEELDRAEGRSLVLRARLSGRSNAHEELRRGSSDLLRVLREGSDATIPFSWWNRVDDASLPPVDFDVLRKGDDFLADLLSVCDELGNGLSEADVEELLGKMPRELRRLASAIVEEIDPTELAETAAVGAIDKLETFR